MVGNPNTGKTTLFNLLTGYRQRVGNYPGVTVERKTGFLRLPRSGLRVEITDLPGAYSLAANSADEAVVLDVLLGRQKDTAAPDILVVVLDAANLARNLFLASQLLEIGRPVVGALNMVDLAEAAGLRIDVQALSDELGIPIVPVVATKGMGIDALKRAIVESVDASPASAGPSFPKCVCEELDGLARSVTEGTEGGRGNASNVELLQTLLDPGGYHERRLLRGCGERLVGELAGRRRRIVEAGHSLVDLEARVRYRWINSICARAVTRVGPVGPPRSEAIDCILTHRWLGLIVLVLLMAGCFQSIYSWAAPLIDAVDGGFSALGAALAGVLPEGAMRSLLVDGAVSGVGAVLVFLPQILILFLFLAILEDCGYLARAAFLLDRWMAAVGLNGKSFIPLVSSFACAVPGIMATRVIENRGDRFVTILVAPLMSCSARLPVYTLLIAAFIPAKPLLGALIGLQTLVLLALYLLGLAVAVIVALALKGTVFRGEPQPFLMELPSYKWPSPLTVLHRVYEQGRVFCTSAGTIIFAMAIVVWALAYYPRPRSIALDYQSQRVEAEQAYLDELDRLARGFDPSLTADTVAGHASVAEVFEQIEAEEEDFVAAVEEGKLEEDSATWRAARNRTEATIAAVASEAGPAGETARAIHRRNVEFKKQLAGIHQRESGAYLRQSILGRLGRWIEPIVKPLGWDWRIGTAVIASFPAREVVIATMGTIYNLGEEVDGASGGLRRKLHGVRWPDGRPVFNVAVALSIVVFFALCCQCGATLAVIKRETNSWRWPIFTFTYMTLLAYLSALVTYQVAIRFA